MNKNKKGFTLMELIAVIVVLGIIVGIVILLVRGSSKKAKEKAEEVFTESLKDAMNIYLDSSRDKLVMDGAIWDRKCSPIMSGGSHTFYKLSKGKSFDEVINSDYAPLSKEDLVNPATGEMCDIESKEITIFRDDMLNLYYFFKLDCLSSCYVTNLPDEFIEESSCGVDSKNCKITDTDNPDNPGGNSNNNPETKYCKFSVDNMSDTVKIGESKEFSSEIQFSEGLDLSNFNVKADGNYFRYDSDSKKFIFNENRSKLTNGTYIYNYVLENKEDPNISCSASISVTVESSNGGNNGGNNSTIDKPYIVNIGFSDSSNRYKSMIYGYQNVETICNASGGTGTYQYQSYIEYKDWLDNNSNNKMTINSNEWYGRREIRCRARSVDGNKYSDWVYSPEIESIYLTFKNVKITLHNDSSTTYVYVPYGSNKIYTQEYSSSDQFLLSNDSSDIKPVVFGYSFWGWFSSSTNGSRVIDSNGNTLKNVSGWTDSNGNFIITSDSNLYAIFNKNKPSNSVFIATSCKFTVKEQPKTGGIFGLFGKRQYTLKKNKKVTYSGNDVRVELEGYETYLDDASNKKTAIRYYYFARNYLDESNLIFVSGGNDGMKIMYDDYAYYDTTGAVNATSHAFPEGTGNAQNGYTFWYGMKSPGTPTCSGNAFGFGVIINTKFVYENNKKWFDGNQSSYLSSVKDQVECSKKWTIQFENYCGY